MDQLPLHQIARTALEDNGARIGAKILSSLHSPSPTKFALNLKGVGVTKLEETRAMEAQLMQQAHPFLKYARASWLLHPMDSQLSLGDVNFRLEAGIWKQWERMVMDGHPLCLSPVSGERHSSITQELVDWAYHVRHVLLIDLVLERPETAIRYFNVDHLEALIRYDNGSGLERLLARTCTTAGSCRSKVHGNLFLLSIASAADLPRACNALIEAGADVTGLAGKIALLSACQWNGKGPVSRGSAAVLAFAGATMDPNVGNSLLLAPVLAGDEKTVALLVKTCGVPVNSTISKYHRSVMHMAASESTSGVLKILLDAGGDVNGWGYVKAKDTSWNGSKDHIEEGTKGCTPLQAALSAGSLDNVRLLLDRGARVSSSITVEQNILDALSDQGHSKYVIRLKEWREQI